MRRLLIAAMVWAGAAGAASAQSADGADPILAQGAVRYACTGVGASSREDPRWKTFPAKLVFAAGDGGYLSDVATRISDARGSVVLDVKGCGPWLLVELPKGRYSVAATAHDGQGRPFDATAALSVGDGGQAQTVLRFPGIPR